MNLRPKLDCKYVMLYLYMWLKECCHNMITVILWYVCVCVVIDTASLPSTISSDVPSSAAQPITAPNPGPDLRLSILHFSYTDLSAATFNFTEGLIGHGAFGSVFRANIRGCGHFAIKKLHNVRYNNESQLEIFVLLHWLIVFIHW